MLRRFRAALVVVVAFWVGGGLAVADPGDVAGVSASACEQRTLVLTAFPAEADAVLARTMLDPNPVALHDNRPPTRWRSRTSI